MMSIFTQKRRELMMLILIGNGFALQMDIRNIAKREEKNPTAG